MDTVCEKVWEAHFLLGAWAKGYKGGDMDLRTEEAGRYQNTCVVLFLLAIKSYFSPRISRNPMETRIRFVVSCAGSKSAVTHGLLYSSKLE